MSFNEDLRICKWCHVGGSKLYRIYLALRPALHLLCFYQAFTESNAGERVIIYAITRLYMYDV